MDWREKPVTSRRLLAINNYFYRRGGAESVFFDQIDLFEGIGWDVVPFAMQHPENAPSAWSPYFVSEIEYGRASGPASKLLQAARSSTRSRPAGGCAPDRAGSPFDRPRPHVYHHLSPSIFEELKRAGIPVVMTVHDLKLACPAYKMLSDGVCERLQGRADPQCRPAPLREGFPRGQRPRVPGDAGSPRPRPLLPFDRRLVTPSRFYRDKLVEWGWDGDRIEYVPNTIDLGRFTPASHEGDYFVFAGRLAPEKGLSTLIRAAAQARQRLVIAGTGPRSRNFAASRPSSMRMSASRDIAAAKSCTGSSARPSLSCFPRSGTRTRRSASWKRTHSAALS